MAEKNRLPPLNALRAFQIAGRHLSFKRAAAELYVSPSAVSQQVKNLEESLGLELFVRRTRALELTGAGQRYFEFLNSMFDRLQSETRQIRTAFGRAIVRLSVPPFFASEALLPKFEELQRMAPNLDIRIGTAPSRMKAHPAEVDLSVLLGTIESSQLITYRLCRRHLAVACSPGIRASQPTDQRFNLDGQTLIIHEHRPNAWKYWADKVGVAPPKPKKVIHFDSMLAVVQAAAAGLGVALISWPHSKAWFDRGDLVMLRDQVIDSGEQFFLAHRPEEGQRQEVMLVAQWILRQFGDQHGRDQHGGEQHGGEQHGQVSFSEP